jgi:hypothetical protein
MLTMDQIVISAGFLVLMWLAAIYGLIHKPQEKRL